MMGRRGGYGYGRNRKRPRRIPRDVNIGSNADGEAEPELNPQLNAAMEAPTLEGMTVRGSTDCSYSAAPPSLYQSLC